MVKKIRKILLILFISILFFPVNVLAEGEDNEGNIRLESTDQMANSSRLYAIDGTGKYAGYKILKGYPNENEFIIYYKGDHNSYMVFTEDLRKINLSEVITWEYNGYLYANTKHELYDFFSDTLQFSSWLGISNELLSQDWFMQTFGDIYKEWGQTVAYSIDGEKLVEEYFKKTGIPEQENTTTLTPDSVIIFKSLSEEDDDTRFDAYDNDNNFIGTYFDEDDINMILARFRQSKELPPKLSEGWISIDLLEEIYEYEVKIQKNNIVFLTSPFVAPQKELLQLKVSDGWMDNDTEIAKVNDIKLKKYVITKVGFDEEWIDIDTLDKEFDVICSIGDTIDWFKLYSPYNWDTKGREMLFKGKWSSNWQRSNNQDIVEINGLRVKREDNINYFNVEDLKKFNIMPKPKKTRIIYLNILDLQRIGLIGDEN